MRHHQQRRNQQRFGGPGSLKSKASTLSARESTRSSPAQTHTSPSIHSKTTLPTTTVNASPGLSIASFEVLIRELEEEEEERKRKEKLTVSQPPTTIPLPVSTPPDVLVPQPQPQPQPQPRPKRPSTLKDVKRRSTGSILFSQPSYTYIAS